MIKLQSADCSPAMNSSSSKLVLDEDSDFDYGENLELFEELISQVEGLVDTQSGDLFYDNSNKNAHLAATQRDLLAGLSSKLYAMSHKNLIPNSVKKLMASNSIKFHDLDYFVQKIHNCSYINLTDCLENGTVINKRKIDQPTNFRVACTVSTQIIAACTASQYGGTTFSIKPLAQFLRKSYERAMFKTGNPEYAKAQQQVDLESGIQTFMYQLNTLMTPHGRPYSTVFMHLEDNFEYEQELAMIIQEILQQRILGIKDETGHYATLAYPKLIYVLDENNIHPDSKYYYLTRLAAECTAKRMVPDYISAKIMRQNYDGQVFPPMGCRSFLSLFKDKTGQYKFEGRMNMGVVTLNLPQIALIASGDKDIFWSLFYERMNVVKTALLCRVKRLSEATTEVAPIQYQFGAMNRLEMGESIGDLLKGGYGTLSVGYIGLYEVCKLMVGQSHTHGEGMEFGLSVLTEMRRLCDEWTAEENYAFQLYGTPSESTAGSFCEKDCKTFGQVKDITDKGWYTNSFHVDVREHVDCFEKLEIESQYQKLSNGGTISYVEIPNLLVNQNAILDIQQHIYDTIMYAEMNTKLDYCRTCRFEGEIMQDDNNKWYCPKCGERREVFLNVVRRTCGYIGENFWNKGKTKEIKDRVEHTNTPVERGIVDFDTANGDGLRVSVWCQGCPHACEGCHNQHLWKFDPEFHLNQQKIVELCRLRKKLSILGGEPLAPQNRREISNIIDAVREEVPDCSIYVWTGYELAELKQSKDRFVRNVILAADKLIVGRFVQDLKVENPMYGSSNQRIMQSHELGELLDW